MIKKELKIIMPSIQTITDTIDMLHKINNNKPPIEMVDDICQRYWVINNSDSPDSCSLFSTDMLVSDIRYCDAELYDSLKKRYSTIVDKFIHREFDFGEKFISIITSMIEKENIDELSIVLFYDDTQLRGNLINLLLNNEEITNKGWTRSMTSNISMTKIIIYSNIKLESVEA